MKSDIFRFPFLPKSAGHVSEIEDVEADESIYKTLPISTKPYVHIQDIVKVKQSNALLEQDVVHMQNKYKDFGHILTDLKQTKGFIAAALAHATSGMTLATLKAKDFDIEAAVAVNSPVIRAKLNALHALGFDQEEGVEDILITLNSQYHLIRLYKKDPSIFFYMALEKAQTNLVLARRALVDTENLLASTDSLINT